MPSVPASPPVPQRKPLQPVVLLRVEYLAGLDDLIAGRGVLTIVSGDETDPDTRLYWTKADIDHRGKVTGFELIEFTSGNRYRLPHDLTSCDCADRIYREERPGGCKHAAALRKALVGMSQATPWPGFRSDDDGAVDLDERWTIVEGAAGPDDEMVDLGKAAQASSWPKYGADCA